MKLLYCQECSDIVAPNPTPRDPRWCYCRLHAVWWEDPRAGILRLYEEGATYRAPNGSSHTWSRKACPHRAFVIGLHNSFLQFPGSLTKESIKTIVDYTPETYAFKTLESVVIRIRPGESNDTDWAEFLPPVPKQLTSHDPPFDGNLCPACPTEVRNLYATAHNAVLAVQHAHNNMGDWSRAFRKIDDLNRAVVTMQPLLDKHFANKDHSQYHTT